MNELKNIIKNGLWKQNPSLVQILGLCPLLAITTSLINGFFIALATLLVMYLSNLTVAMCRNFIPHTIRIPVFILLAAGVVTIVDILLNTYLHSLWLVLGIFIPLIITNCIVLARIEAFAAKNPPLNAQIDGIMMGLGLVWTLSLLGGIREVLGAGTLFAGIEMINSNWTAIQILPLSYSGFLLAILPPGAFLTLAALIAGKNYLELQSKQSNHTPPQPTSVTLNTPMIN